MFRAYRNGSITSGNEISGQIIGINPITWGLNWDLTMELPELQISTTIDDIALGEKIIICDAADNTKRVMFYVKSQKYDYKTKKYELQCPHAFEMLNDYLPADIVFPTYGTTWTDVNPGSGDGYLIYNNQMGDVPNQGQYVWPRTFVQALFLLKMLIYRSTGTSVAIINDTDVADKDSFYYDKYSNYGQEYTTYYKYGELGLAISSLRRLGTSRHDELDNLDEFGRAALPSCFQLLRIVCQALGVTINIFRSDYLIEAIAQSSAPTDALTIGRKDELIEQVRRVAVSVTGMPDPDWEYGTYDENNTLVPYTFGVDNPDVELVERYAEDDTSASTTRTISVSWPSHFRILAIISGGAGFMYRTHVDYIEDDVDDLTDHDMWLAMLRSMWEDIGAVNEYETAMSDLSIRKPRCTMDLPRRHVSYQLWEDI